MGRIFFIFCILLAFQTNAQFTAIPDPNFEQALIDLGIDSDGVINGQVLTSDIETLTSLEVIEENISDFTGIQDFTALETLDCGGNMITNLNLSENLMLQYLNLYYNCFLTSLNITNNTLLTYLNCSQSNLTTLDLSGNPNLEFLYCGNPDYDVLQQNFLSSLDLSNNPKLKVLEASFNSNLSDINISNCPELESLYAIFCDLNTIDVSQNTQLKQLVLGDDYGFFMVSNNLEGVDVSNNPQLETLWVDYCNLQHLNVKNGNNTVLTNLNAYNNPALYCIEVDDEIAANNGEFPYSEWLLDPQANFSENCALNLPDFLAAAVKIYPNPVGEILNLEFTAATKPKKIRIYDITGRLLFQQEDHFKQLQVSHLATGTFLLEMEFSEGTLVSKFFKE